MIRFLRDNHATMTNQQLADAMGLKLTKVREKCYELGLYRMRLEYWTQDQIDFLQAYYEILGDVELAEVFNTLWCKNKGWTKKHIEKKRRYLKLKRSRAQIQMIHERNTKTGRFAKHHWKRWDGIARNQGDIAIWKHESGRQTVVVKWSGGTLNEGTYERLAWINWLLEHGETPQEGMNLIHKDGDPLNCSIDNLKLITNRELASMNRNPEKTSQALKELYERDHLRVMYGMKPRTKTLQNVLDRKRKLYQHVIGIPDIPLKNIDL